MNRRETLKALGITTLGAAIVPGACKSPSGKTAAGQVPVTGRQDFEILRDRRLAQEQFFDAHEMATITILADLVIPRDEKSGSASDAEVPTFIAFIVKDEPEHQLPMRGGLKWLDVESLRRYNNDFIHCTPQQQTALLNDIAYPSKAPAAMQPGVAFFNKMRELTAIGFFTSKMGIADLGYKGNTPGKWNGVPADVLKQYGLEDV